MQYLGLCFFRYFSAMGRWALGGGLLLLLAVSISSLSGCKRQGLAPGENAPEIKAVALDGRPISLADFRGKTVLVNFWASWCGPCVLEMPALQKLHESLQAKGFSVLALAVDDDLELVKQFQKEKGLTFPIAMASNDDLRAYKLSGFPETLILDSAGKIVMFLDPADGSPTSRVLGPRDWSGPQALSSIGQVVK